MFQIIFDKILSVYLWRKKTDCHEVPTNCLQYKIEIKTKL